MPAVFLPTHCSLLLSPYNSHLISAQVSAHASSDYMKNATIAVPFAPIADPF